MATPTPVADWCKVAAVRTLKLLPRTCWSCFSLHTCTDEPGKGAKWATQQTTTALVGRCKLMSHPSMVEEGEPCFLLVVSYSARVFVSTRHMLFFSGRLFLHICSMMRRMQVQAVPSVFRTEIPRADTKMLG